MRRMSKILITRNTRMILGGEKKEVNTTQSGTNTLFWWKFSIRVHKSVVCYWQSQLLFTAHIIVIIINLYIAVAHLVEFITAKNILFAQ